MMPSGVSKTQEHWKTELAVRDELERLIVSEVRETSDHRPPAIFPDGFTVYDFPSSSTH